MNGNGCSILAFCDLVCIVDGNGDDVIYITIGYCLVEGDRNE